jgi:hypothetical protein
MCWVCSEKTEAKPGLSDGWDGFMLSIDPKKFHALPKDNVICPQENTLNPYSGERKSIAPCSAQKKKKKKKKKNPCRFMPCRKTPLFHAQQKKMSLPPCPQAVIECVESAEN